MQKMITILGPTASGKTPLAARLAVKVTKQRRYSGRNSLIRSE